MQLDLLGLERRRRQWALGATTGTERMRQVPRFWQVTRCPDDRPLDDDNGMTSTAPNIGVADGCGGGDWRRATRLFVLDAEREGKNNLWLISDRKHGILACFTN